MIVEASHVTGSISVFFYVIQNNNESLANTILRNDEDAFVSNSLSFDASLPR
jgi:translation initiation factor 6 (eIF-6)